jgi:hypothetical protein
MPGHGIFAAAGQSRVLIISRNQAIRICRLAELIE